MTRGRAMIVAAVATVLLLAAMAPAEQRIQDTGGPGIVPFELSGGQERADEILAEWGEEGRAAARESLWIDFGFLVAYGILLTLAIAATRDTAARRGWRRLARLGPLVAPFGALSALCDAIENVFLLLTIEGAGALAPLLATIFAGAKFLFAALAIAYVGAGLLQRLRRAPAGQGAL